jgi:hypothetical protein
LRKKKKNIQRLLLVLFNKLRSWGLFPTKISLEVGNKLFNPPSGEKLFKNLTIFSFKGVHPKKKRGGFSPPSSFFWAPA